MRAFARWWAPAMGMMVASLALAGSAQAAIVGSKPVTSWQTNGRVTAIAIQGTTAYLGGKFTSLRPAGAPLGTGEVARSHAAAIDLATGSLLPWNPNVSSTVQAIAANGSTIYLGGAFAKVGGKTRSRLAAVDATTGAVLKWKTGSLNGQVAALAVGNGVLYAGGSFTTIAAASHPYLAAFDLASGAFDAGWAPTVNAQVKAMVVTTDGTHVVVAGAFTALDGTFSPAIGAVHPVTGANLPWAWHAPFPSFPSFSIVALAADANGVYAGGTGNGGSYAGMNPSTGALLWEGGVDGNVQAMTVLDGIVYVGGHYIRWCGPVLGWNSCPAVANRDKLIAVDEVTGALQAWHPSANSVLGVFAMAAGDGRVAAGGDFTKLGGVATQMFGMFSS
jgi:hypothetical protein